MIALVLAIACLPACHGKRGSMSFVAGIPSEEPCSGCKGKNAIIRETPGVVLPVKNVRRGSTLDLDFWKKILIDRGHLRWRKRWPASEPFAVSLHLPSNVPPIEAGLEIELVPRMPGWVSAKAQRIGFAPCGMWSDCVWSFESYQELGMLPAGHHAIEFELTVTTPLSWKRTQPWEPTPTGIDHFGPIVVEVDAVEDFEEVLAPYDDSAFVKKLALGIHIQESERGQALLFFDTSFCPVDLGLSLELTLKRAGVAVETRAIAFPRGSDAQGPIALAKLPAAALRDPKELARWWIELRGIQRGSVANWQAKRYWAGRAWVPLCELVRQPLPRSRSRSRRNRRMPRNRSALRRDRIVLVQVLPSDDRTRFD
jgi:hypothetical protein